MKLRCEAGEDVLDFVQRAEDLRCYTGVSQEAALMLIWGQLPASIKQKLEDYHDMAGLGRVQWDDLVNFATK